MKTADDTSSLTSPDDRLPTFEEIKTFSPTAGWDRLTPAQQRQVGVVGGVLSYQHDHLTKAEAGEVTVMESDLLTGFTAAIEPLWGQLYGWTLDWFEVRRAA